MHCVNVVVVVVFRTHLREPRGGTKKDDDDDERERKNDTCG